MIDWSNTRVLRAGGWSEKPVERKQRCDWLRDGGVIFFLSMFFVRRVCVQETFKHVWGLLWIYVTVYIVLFTYAILHNDIIRQFIIL